MIIGVTLPLLLLVTPPAPVATDRPDVTNGPLTVPRGAWQMEVGLDTEVSRRPLERSSLTFQTSLRIGVHKRAELRLLEGDVVRWAAAASRNRAGFRADAPTLEFGAKIRLTEGRPDHFVPSFGLQPLLAFRPPLASRLGAPIVGLALIISQPLGRRVTLDSNAAIRMDSNPASHTALSGYLTGSMGVQVHPKLLTYAEVVGGLGARADRSMSIDGGFIYNCAARVALDLSARALVVGPAPSYGVVVGMTAMLFDGQRSRRNARIARKRRQHDERVASANASIARQ
ncbi:MAG: hypothetical protein IAG13_15975 [Deltaproteobacteria bacterium]|nr:hypothetical protein [Nannocystaceae bacterium]